MLSKKFAVGFGIAIILPMLIHYGVSTFSPSPKQSDYYQFNYSANDTPEQRIKARQDMQKKQEEFRISKKRFELHLFYVAVPLGIIAILFGASVPIQAVGTGLMFGGIFSVMDGYIWYWSELPDLLRFLSLLIAFIVLIFIGYRKLSK